MKLAYKAVGKNGKVTRGVIEAKDVQEAASYLRAKEILPIHIAEKKGTNILKYLPFFNKTKNDVVLFTRQLSSMISSGLTLLQSLRLLQDQIGSVQMKELVRNIIADIEDGSSFSKAISRYPETFGSVYIS